MELLGKVKSENFGVSLQYIWGIWVTYEILKSGVFWNVGSWRKRDSRESAPPAGAFRQCLASEACEEVGGSRKLLLAETDVTRNER